MSPSQRPQLILAPSISTTKVVTTTTTTTTYEPITLPPLPTPSTPKNAKDFPLYHAELPASVRQFPLIFPNGAHATFSDGGPLPPSSSSNPAHSEAGGQYWRQLRRDEQSDSSKVVGLAEAVEKFGRKRSHVTAEADMMEGVESATQQDSHGTLHAFSSPPRKKARGLTLPPLSTAVGGAAPPSPLPSPNGSPSPTMQPECVWPAAVTPPNESVPSSPPPSQSQIQHPQQPTPPIQPDLALTTLLSLPNLVSHFSALPPALQSHFLLTLLRHSPLSVLRTLHGVLTPTLARDFLTILPPELVSTILSFLPYATLARASRVSKAWRAIVDSDPVLWRDLLQDTRIWFGGDSERAFARAVYARRRRLGLPGPSELPMPHPYKLLFTSRHLTRTRWQAQTAPVHKTFPAHGVSVVTCLLFSRGRVISASDDHSIHVYSPVTGELLRALDGHEGGVWALAATGDTLVSGSTDRTVRIWDLSTGRCTHVFGGHTSTVRCLSVVKPEWVEMEDGTREKWPKRSVIVTGSRDHSLRVWNLPRKGEGEYKCYGAEDGDVDPEEDDVEANPYHLRHLEGHEHAVRALAARGRTLVSGSYDCTVRVWDIITGKRKWTLTGHQQKVYSVVYDPGRKQACSGSMDGTVRIWSLTNGTCLHTLMGHTSLVGLLGLSPSSLVSAAADSTLRIWDPDTGALRHTLSGHTGAITCFQHDEFKVLSGSDGTLKMWDIRDGAPVRNLLTGIVGVWQVVFEGRWCVAASNRNDQTWLDVWDFGREGDHGWIGESPSGMYDEDSDGEDTDDDDEEEEDMLELKEEERARRRREKEKAREDAMDEDEEERPEELSEPEVDEELGVEAHLTEPEHEEYHRRHHASIPAKSQDQQLRNTSWGSSALSASTAHALARALPPVEETPTKPRGKGSTRRR